MSQEISETTAVSRVIDIGWCETCSKAVTGEHEHEVDVWGWMEERLTSFAS